MDTLNKFFNSLATRGGAIFILLLLSLTGFAITLHIIHANEEGSMVAAGLVTTVGNFTGALLLALKGSSDSTATTTTTPSGQTTSVATTGEAAAQVTNATPKP